MRGSPLPIASYMLLAVSIRGGLAMKIVVKAEKAGQRVAQSECEVMQEDLRTTARKAFVRLWKQHPDLPLFDDDVRIKFEKTE
jgi:hypothetical protein